MASTTDFFSVSAQIIPVLFIAIAFEHRAFGRLEGEPEKDVGLATARFFAFILIVWGEVAALNAVSAHHGTTAEHSTVTMALIAEAAILSIEPTRAFMRAGAGDKQRHRDSRVLQICCSESLVLYLVWH